MVRMSKEAIAVIIVKHVMGLHVLFSPCYYRYIYQYSRQTESMVRISKEELTTIVTVMTS